jgi:hypothetical protein
MEVLIGRTQMEKSKIGLKILEKYIFIILIVIIICQLLVIGIFGVLKESYFVDEIHTFGLSNSYYKPFITWHEEPNSWHDSNFYLNYLTVQSNERFAYDSVYYNQVNDVHPPLYYFGIHTLCSFFPNVFSKWIGIIYNIPFFIGTIIFLFFLSKLIYDDELLSIVICISYGFSAGAISHTIFIRMYMMLTFFVVMTTYLHGLLIKNQTKTNNILYIIIIIINLLGFLTQYLFIVYAFFVACGYIIYLLKQSRWRDIIIYILGIIVSIGFSIFLFPELLEHIFFEKLGTDVIGNLTTINDFLLRIWEFLLLLVKSMVIFLLSILILFSIRPFSYLNRVNLDSSTSNNRSFNFSNYNKAIFRIIIYATILSFLVIVKISPYLGVRYISYLFPNIALISTVIAYSKLLVSLNDRKLVLKFLSLLICISYIFSYIFGGVYYINKNSIDIDNVLSKYFSYDAYCISSNVHYNTAVIPLIMNHNYSMFVDDNEDLINIINYKIGDPVVLYFPNWDTSDEGDLDIMILKNIIEKSEYSSYRKLLKKEDSGVDANIYLLE